MEKDRPSPNELNELEALKRKYEELQLRITRFSVTEQELIYARNQLDREVLIYRRMQRFNSLAFEEMNDEAFMKMVCESLLDIFELEIALMIIDTSNPDIYHLQHVEGHPVDNANLSRIREEVKNYTSQHATGVVYHRLLEKEDTLYGSIPFKNTISIKVWDPELKINVILLCGNSEKGSLFYEDMGSDREAAFSVFAQQVLAHQINRNKTQKITHHVNELTRDQLRITRIAESFLKFDTEPEKNFKKIVQLTAELLSANCAVLETLNGETPIFSDHEAAGSKLTSSRYAHPCYDLMKAGGERMLQIPRLELKGEQYRNSWILPFAGHRFIGSVIQIDKEPIGTLALFVDPQKVITDNLLQLIRIMSVAIAVEERRRRALNALKESEEKYRVMFEGSPNGILVVDIDSLCLQYVNPSICNMFGYTSDEMLELTVDQLHPDSLKKIVREGVRGVTPQSNSLINDMECVRKDGTVFFADIYSNYISFGGRQLVAGFFSDVTQRRDGQQALLASNTELKKINAELDNFVYSVSHDLRAPLLAIQGLIRLIDLNGETQTADTENYLGMMMASANRMDETIKEILEYSRNARLGLTVEPIDFNYMIEEIFTDVKHIFPKSPLLQLEVVEEEKFYSDPNRIVTLLKNLIGNAVKYQRTDIEQPYLKIYIHTDKDSALMRFEDNGEGIAPEHINKIFDMFYRASNTTVGTGLGLYICREIVHNLGGNITAESTPGEGSRFLVQIKNLKY